MVHARLAAGAVRWSGLQVSRRLTHSYARSAALNIHASHDCARLFRPNVPAQKWAGGVRYSSTTASSKSTSLVKLSTPQGLEQCQTFGFCFDIDGVLYQGSNKVAATLPTLKFLTDHGVGLVLLTNGGGKVVEDERARRLEAKLGVPEGRDILRGRVIQSHTPSRGWPEQVKNQTVFITGSDPEAARKIAKSYGFTNVVTSHDLLRGNPALYPFDHKLGNAEGEDKPEPRGAVLPKRIWNADPFDHDGARRSDALRIDKVLIWNDPRDWSVDIQLIYDMLISHRGYLGTVSGRNGDGSLPNGGWQQDGQPEVWMSNLDLFWKTEYGVNRYGTGAFLEALKGVWAASTGGAPLRFRAMGKPFKESYDYAERLLLSQTTASTDTAESEGETTTPMKRVYMIGDNPESDIRGASEYQSSKGVEWVPILVRTGVWQETEGRKTPPYSPAAVVDDVLDAVVWAMRNEGLDVDRALVSRLYREHGWEQGA